MYCSRTQIVQISAQLNNIPLAAGDVSNSPNQPFSVLSPNRLMTGRNHHRFAHYHVTVDPHLPSQLVARNDQIVSSFMKTYARSVMLLNARPSKWPLNSSSHSPPPAR